MRERRSGGALRAQSMVMLSSELIDAEEEATRGIARRTSFCCGAIEPKRWSLSAAWCE